MEQFKKIRSDHFTENGKSLLQVHIICGDLDFSDSIPDSELVRYEKIYEDSVYTLFDFFVVATGSMNQSQMKNYLSNFIQYKRGSNKKFGSYSKLIEYLGDYNSLMNYLGKKNMYKNLHETLLDISKQYKKDEIDKLYDVEDEVDDFIGLLPVEHEDFESRFFDNVTENNLLVEKIDALSKEAQWLVFEYIKELYSDSYRVLAYLKKLL